MNVLTIPIVGDVNDSVAMSVSYVVASLKAQPVLFVIDSHNGVNDGIPLLMAAVSAASARGVIFGCHIWHAVGTSAALCMVCDHRTIGPLGTFGGLALSDPAKGIKQRHERADEFRAYHGLTRRTAARILRGDVLEAGDAIAGGLASMATSEASALESFRRRLKRKPEISTN